MTDSGLSGWEVEHQQGAEGEERKAQAEAAKAELPDTLSSRELQTQKSNHPSLAVGNKLKLQCPVTSLEDVTSGLVLCCLAVDDLSFSKRFCPELINFLLGVLHLAVPDKTSTGVQVTQWCRPSGRAGRTLTLATDLDTDHYRLSPVATSSSQSAHCSPNTFLSIRTLQPDMRIMGKSLQPYPAPRHHVIPWCLRRRNPFLLNCSQQRL
ncbi:hypothetical protein J4Q44_G00076130 [Coregonus suidteri]|uniref:Uncharacterized protein n=1 Tax=Coregonus suidteri TaxID=861788 RepID=A0AAN8R2Z1_9TELE